MSTGLVPQSSGGIAMVCRNWRISGMRSMLVRSYVPCRMDVVILFLVNRGMILPNVPDTPGVSMAWLK